MHSIHSDNRKSGISLIGDLAWGSHFCLFYRTEQDLVDLLVPYFKAGLESNEFCLWAVSKPLSVEDARQALREALPGFDRAESEGRIEVLPFERLRAREEAPSEPLVDVLDEAISRGCSGLRFACNAVPEGKRCKPPACYGAESVSHSHAIAAYAYPHAGFDAVGLMEVVKHHRFALVRNTGGWDVIESSEARTVKDALRRSEEKLQSLFGNMSEGFAYHRIVLDSKGTPCDYVFLEVNQAFEKLTGLQARDIIGRRAGNVLPGIEKDPTDWIGRYGKVALTGEPAQFESYSEALERWFSVSAFSPHRGYFAVTFSDITERKRAEEKIRRQSAIMEGINRIFREALACATEEDLGRTCLTVAEEVTASKFGFIGEIDSQGFLHAIAISDPGWELCQMGSGAAALPGSFKIHGVYGRVLRDGKSVLTNAPAEHPDSIGTPPGHPALRAFLGVPLVAAGQTTGMIAVGNREGGYRQVDREALEALSSVVVEAFARKRAEDELRRNREWLRVTLASIGDGVIATDASGRVTFLNPVAEALTGWQVEAACGCPVQTVFRIINEESRQPAENIVERVLREGVIVNLANHTALITRDGREVPIEDSAAPIRDGAGNIIGVVLVFHDVTEKRRAQEALVRSKEEWERTFRSIPDLIAILDNEHRVVRANPAMAKRLGLTPDACAGVPCYRAVHGLDDPPKFCPHSHTLSDGREHATEVHEERLGGHFLVSTTPIFDDEGRITGTVHVARDITERKRMEEELRQSRDELELRVQERTAELIRAGETLREQARQVDAFFAHSISPLVFLNRDLHFVRVNEAYARVCGHSAQEFIGRNHFEMYPSEELETQFRKVVETRQPYQVFGRPFTFPDHPEWGVSYWDLQVEPILDSGGQVDFLVFSLDDVTEQKKAELAIHKSEQLLRGVLEALPVGVWILGKDGRIVDGNPAGQGIWAGSKFVGLEEYGAYKAWWAETGEPVKAEEWAAARAITQGETSIDELIDIECFDGTRKTILNSALPLLNRGQIDGAVIVNQDITKRVRMERDLRAYARRLELVNQELQEFAFVASHDLQEPLRKIQSFGDMLRRKCAADLDETGISYVLRMEKAATRMRALIQDLLRFSRVAARPAPYKTVNLNGVLREVLQVFEVNPAEDCATIEVSDLPEIDADETQMKQLFQNLIGNALKYRKKDATPEIRICSSIEDEAVCRILVEDNGIGFEQEFTRKIFAPFQRLHAKGEYEGTGMGLAICRKIVERHGGTITAESRPGKGSTFIVCLPVRQVKRGSLS